MEEEHLTANWLLFFSPSPPPLIPPSITSTAWWNWTRRWINSFWWRGQVVWWWISPRLETRHQYSSAGSPLLNCGKLKKNFNRSFWKRDGANFHGWGSKPCENPLRLNISLVGAGRYGRNIGSRYTRRGTTNRLEKKEENWQEKIYLKPKKKKKYYLEIITWHIS